MWSLLEPYFPCLAPSIIESDVQDRWIYHRSRLQHVLQYTTMWRPPRRPPNSNSVTWLPRRVPGILALPVDNRVHRGKSDSVHRQRLLCCQVPPCPIWTSICLPPPSPCSTDNLTIRNGPYSNSPVLWTGCGTSFPPDLMSMSNKVFSPLLAVP